MIKEFPYFRVIKTHTDDQRIDNLFGYGWRIIGEIIKQSIELLEHTQPTRKEVEKGDTRKYEFIFDVSDVDAKDGLFSYAKKHEKSIKFSDFKCTDEKDYYTNKKTIPCVIYQSDHIAMLKEPYFKIDFEFEDPKITVETIRLTYEEFQRATLSTLTNSKMISADVFVGSKVIKRNLGEKETFEILDQKNGMNFQRSTRIR